MVSLVVPATAVPFQVMNVRPESLRFCVASPTLPCVPLATQGAVAPFASHRLTSIAIDDTPPVPPEVTAASAPEARSLVYTLTAPVTPMAPVTPTYPIVFCPAGSAPVTPTGTVPVTPT